MQSLLIRYSVGTFLTLMVMYILAATLTLHVVHAHEDNGVELAQQVEVGTPSERSLLRERLRDTRAHSRTQRQEILEQQKTTRSEFETRREDLEQRRDLSTGELEEKRESFKARWGGRKDEIIDRRTNYMIAFMGTVEERFIAAIERLENIANRIASRAEIFEERGAEISETEAALTLIYQDLDAAKALVAVLSVTAERILAGNPSNSPQTIFAGIRTAINEIKTLLKNIYGNLRDAVVNLKVRNASGIGGDVQNSNDNEDSIE